MSSSTIFENDRSSGSSGFAKQETSRPFSILSGDARITVDIPAAMWPTAEHQRSSLPVVEQESALDLMIRVLETVGNATFGNASYSNHAESISFLSILFLHLQKTILCDNDIHAAIKDLDPDKQAKVLRTYYQCSSNLASSGHVQFSDMISDSRLLKAVETKEATLFAIFGGQGNVEAYFEELVALVDVYKPLVQTFLLKAARTLASHSESKEALVLRVDPIDLMRWIEDPGKII